MIAKRLLPLLLLGGGCSGFPTLPCPKAVYPAASDSVLVATIVIDTVVVRPACQP